MRAWLVKQGYVPGDLCSEKKVDDYYRGITPIEWALKKGELTVHEWLRDNGGLVPDDVRAWFVQHGFKLGDANFKPGDLRSEKLVYLEGGDIEHEARCLTPMAYACFKGELKVCKWLYNHGAAEDVTKEDEVHRTPMLFACWMGHLSVCKWLYKVGGGENMLKAISTRKWCAMHFASKNGHLSVCKWLFKMNSGKGISKRNIGGQTPMRLAYIFDHLSICKWLVLNGALNHPIRTSDDDADASSDGGHIDKAIVKRDTVSHVFQNIDHRPALLEWAKKDVLATHHTFLHVVLHASVIFPASQRHNAPNKRCCLPRLFRSDHLILRRVGLFAGVETGRQLRNAREFAEVFDSRPRQFAEELDARGCWLS